MVTQYTHKKTNGFNKKPAPRAGLSKWMLTFLACGCMFVLGILIGRNNAPVNFDMESLDQKLSELPASVMADATSADGQKSLEEMPFDFYDQLKEETVVEEVSDEKQVIQNPLKKPKSAKKPPSVMTAKVMLPGQAPDEVLGLKAKTPETDTLLASAEKTEKPEAAEPPEPEETLTDLQDRKIEQPLLNKAVARIEPQVAPSPTLSPAPEPQAPAEAEEPAVVETPASAEPPVAPEPVIQEPEPAEQPPPAVAAKTPEPEEPQAAPEPQAVQEPEPEEPAPPAEKIAATGTARGYSIQVASLKEVDKANTVRDKFRSKGYPAYTQQAVVEGKGQWCRVRIGPYPDKAHAQSDLSRLQKAGVDAILFFVEP